MEDTFIGGEVSDISISLWFTISGILAFSSILFFYFTKIKDLKSQKVILTGITLSWIFISIFQIILFKNYFYLSLLTIIPIITCYLAIKTLKIEIIKQLNKKGLSEKKFIFYNCWQELKKNKIWWARQDSNLGPIHYECTALTN